MNKYQPLTSHLRVQRADRVPMTFVEIEQVIGDKLPQSAVLYRAWWSNNGSNNVMTKAWLDAGFQSEQVDLEGRKLTFRRIGPSVPPPEGGAPKAPQDAQPGRPALFGWMKGTISIAPGVDLAAPADPDWERRLDHE